VFCCFSFRLEKYEIIQTFHFQQQHKFFAKPTRSGNKRKTISTTTFSFCFLLDEEEQEEEKQT